MFVLPLRQWTHSWHCGENSVTTWSPGASEVTPEPTASITPPPSCPSTVGAYPDGSTPEAVYMSVWQTPHAASLINASPAFGAAMSTSVTTSGLANCSSTAARILMSEDPLFVNRPGAMDEPHSARLGVDEHLGDRRMLGPHALLDLARDRVSGLEVARRVECERQVGDEALRGLAEFEPERVASAQLPYDPRHVGALCRHRCAVRRRSLARGAQRLDVRVDDVYVRHGAGDRALHLACHRVRIAEVHLRRQLQVQRELRSAVDVQHADVVHLAHPARSHRGGRHLLAQRRGGGARLDVDDDVASRKHPLHRALDLVRGRVSLRDAGVLAHSDNRVGEVASGRLAQP